MERRSRVQRETKEKKNGGVRRDLRIPKSEFHDDGSGADWKKDPKITIDISATDLEGSMKRYLR